MKDEKIRDRQVEREKYKKKIKKRLEKERYGVSNLLG